MPAWTLLSTSSPAGGSIVRSAALPVSYERPADTRAAIAATVDAGFDHIVLILPAPYPDLVTSWVATQLIA